MGLPVWREPKAASETKSAIKNDPTARARSSIRRDASIHHHHHHHHHAGHHSHASHHGERSVRVLGNPGFPSSHPRRLTSPSPPPPSSRDDLVPPVPLLTWRDGVPSMPTHPRRIIEHVRIRRLQRMREQGADTRRAELALIHNRVAEDARAEREALSEQSSMMAAPDSPGSQSDRPLSRRGEAAALDELPRLRRVNGRSINDATPPTVRSRTSFTDGLGDRRRSPSSDSVTDNWDTILSTITPDTSLPSTDSSFNNDRQQPAYSGMTFEQASSPASPTFDPTRPAWAPRTRRRASATNDQIAMARHRADPSRRLPLFGSFEQRDDNDNVDDAAAATAARLWPSAPPSIPGCDDDEAEDAQRQEGWTLRRSRSSLRRIRSVIDELNNTSRDMSNAAEALRDAPSSSMTREELVSRLEVLLQRTEREMRNATDFHHSVSAWTDAFGSGETLPAGTEVAVRQQMLRMSETLGELQDMAQDTSQLINDAGMRHIEMGRHEGVISAAFRRNGWEPGSRGDRHANGRL